MLRQDPEGCQSGRLGRSRKPLWPLGHRGFESHPLRLIGVAFSSLADEGKVTPCSLCLPPHDGVQFFPTMMRRIASGARAHPWAILLVTVYLALGVTYSVVNPIHEATDELRHYRYVRYIADYGQLPVQSAGEGNAQAHHPPLYYATAALASFWVHPSDPLYTPPTNPHWGFRNWEVGVDNKNMYLHGPDEAWPYRDAALAAHLARWVTLLWGAATVALTYAMAHTLFPDRPAIALASGGWVAFNPMFLYLGAAINNDVPAALIGAAISLLSLHTFRDGLTTRTTLMLGLFYGLGALVKFNLIAMLAVIELTLWLVIFPADTKFQGHKAKWLSLLKANGIILGIALVLAGWWYIRNVILYGEPTGFLRLTEIWGARNPQTGIALAGRELRHAWTTFWGRFGYGQIPLPDGFYVALAALCGVGLLGLAVFLLPSRSHKPAALSTTQWRMIATLFVAVLINLAVLYTYITVSPAGAMGRFLFPGLPAFATLIAIGLLGLWPTGMQTPIAATITSGLATFSLIALFGYLAPAYATPSQVTPPSDPLNIPIGDVARILAYEVSPDLVLPGEKIDVTVTWEVIRPTDQPCAVFIHLMTPLGVPIVQRDTYTGLGNYPSIWWRPGYVFTETYSVYLPEIAYSPDEAIVWLGLYQQDGVRAPIEHQQARNNALKLGTVTVEADPNAQYPNPVFVNWDDKFALVGYEIEPRVLRQGQRIEVTLYWEALAPPRDADYKVFLHLLEGWEAKWAGNDGNPGHPDASTRDWEVGEVYADERWVRLPLSIPPGIYQLELGWFSGADNHRLNIVADDGHIVDDWLLLSNIRVLSRNE